MDEDPESDTYGERLYKDEDGNSYPLTNSHTGQPLTLEELRGLSEDGQKLLRRREKEAGLDKNEEVDDGKKHPDFGKYNASGSTISPLHEPGSDRIKIARDQYISTIGGAVSKEPKEYHYPIMPARQSHRPTDDMMVTTEGTPKGWPTGRSRSLTDAELPAGYMGPPPPETTPEELEAQGHDVRTSEDPMVMAWSNILKNIKISQ